MTAYFDESYAALPTNKGYMVVCGWIASVEEWERFEVDWKLFLISYKVPYFHMKEFAHSVGPYKKWAGTTFIRARFIKGAHEIIRRHVRKGLVCCIHDEQWQWADRLYKLREDFPSTYAVAGRTCIDWAESIGRTSQQQVGCIFDDGNPGKGDLIRAADIAPMVPSPIFKPSRDVQDRKMGMRRGFVPIQAADFLAYEISKYVKDVTNLLATTNGKVKARESLRMFGAKAPTTMFFDQRHLTAFCLHFGIGRRNLSANAPNAKGQAPR